MLWLCNSGYRQHPHIPEEEDVYGQYAETVYNANMTRMIVVNFVHASGKSQADDDVSRGSCVSCVNGTIGHEHTNATNGLLDWAPARYGCYFVLY